MSSHVKSSFALAISCALACSAACSKKAPTPSCDGVNKGVDAVTAMQLKSAPPVALAHIKDVTLASAEKMKSLLRERCTVDRWSAEAINCVTNAVNSKQLNDCKINLTAEQSKALEDARRESAKAGTRMPPSPPTEPAAPLAH
jgi:hypothetical protein